MSTTLLERPVETGAGNGGVPARRAVTRWAWRLFWREWRQQSLVLALIVVAVAATIVGATVATNSPAPANAGFGTARYMVNLSVGPRLTTDLAALKAHFGTLDVIENQTVAIPGSIDTFDLRAQSPQGAYGQPMLHLVAGRYPSTANEVAVTPVVASDFNLAIGAVWHFEGRSRRVVGTVENPQSLLDAFALVPPGQVPTPTTVTVLLDATPSSARHSTFPVAPAGAVRSTAPRPTRVVASIPPRSCSSWPPWECSSSAWWPWPASRCWPSAGCARSACWAPWGPPTRTSGSWCAPTGRWWE